MTEAETRQKLLRAVKKEVKQISEEAVTRKFVHEESSSITSLCGAVEACLLHGLKKRSLGLFKHGTTSALLQKLSKHYEPAWQILNIVQEIETNNDPTSFSKAFNHQITKTISRPPPTPPTPPTPTRNPVFPDVLSSQQNPQIYQKFHTPTSPNGSNMAAGFYRLIDLFSSLKSLDGGKVAPKKNLPSYNPKYLWLRIAIFEKQLAKILDYLVQNSSKYYESDALLADPVDGPILASLLVGPCALDYTKMKTSDHYWTDPPADELVQRHRIHSGATHHLAGPGSPKRPALQQVRRHTSSSSEESAKTQQVSAKEYVESLHQNSKNTLLYGKNNVLVQPKEDIEALAGYLSLHQSAEGLTIKWTPNQLMNGCYEDKEDDFDRRCYLCAFLREPRETYRRFLPHGDSETQCKTLYWDYALTIYIDEIVYIHCHQQPDYGGTIVLVGQDGVQRPPIHFPKGGHLLAFLSCLENGLLPNGQLDPPLWSQRGKGKVFPKLRRKCTKVPSKEGQNANNSSTDEEEAADYVFRINDTFKPHNILPEFLDAMMDILPWPTVELPPVQLPPALLSSRHHPPSIQSTVQSYAKAQEEQNITCLSRVAANHSRTTIKQLCDTMKQQIISRAFYGWLAHCRHLKTVRTHLSGLVHHNIISAVQPTNATPGLTPLKWADICIDGKIDKPDEMYRLVYYGGVTHDIRKQVWPYLLGHYGFDSTEKEREAADIVVHTAYEQTMSEWLAVEAIVRQRDKEIMAANLAKLSSESSHHNGQHAASNSHHHHNNIDSSSNNSSRKQQKQQSRIPLVRKDSNLSNDVFISTSFDDDDDDLELDDDDASEEGSLSPTTTTTAELSKNHTVVVVAKMGGLPDDKTEKSSVSTEVEMGERKEEETKGGEGKEVTEGETGAGMSGVVVGGIETKEGDDGKEVVVGKEEEAEVEENGPSITITTTTTINTDTAKPSSPPPPPSAVSEGGEITTSTTTTTTTTTDKLDNHQDNHDNNNHEHADDDDDDGRGSSRDEEEKNSVTTTTTTTTADYDDDDETLKAAAAIVAAATAAATKEAAAAAAAAAASLYDEDKDEDTTRARGEARGDGIVEVGGGEVVGGSEEGAKGEGGEESKGNEGGERKREEEEEVVEKEKLKEKKEEEKEEKEGMVTEGDGVDSPVETHKSSSSSSSSSSPDDGLGDSIARPASLTDNYNRSKLDSAGDSEEGVSSIINTSSTTNSKNKDVSSRQRKAPKEGSLDKDKDRDKVRGVSVTTKSSVDSAGVDDDDLSSTGEDLSDQVNPPTTTTTNCHNLTHVREDDDIDDDDDDGEHLDKKRGSLANSLGSEAAQRLSASKESLISPASPASNGGIYSPELLDNVALNLHRIDKDVQRCDRNYWYFSPENLDKLRNIMCTYVWEHLDIGYVQGMCDLVAPLLVIFDDEALTYSCFCELMKRMAYNFPHGGAMDNHFANMRSLIQILDCELFEHMHQNGDYTHFYFCYRWFLLDFKRELVYEDVFSVWETIWAAKHISSSHFVLFIALALVEYYRDIILDNNMDFTDIIKFFNEMAERHNAKQVLKIARELVFRIQTLIENK